MNQRRAPRGVLRASSRWTVFAGLRSQRSSRSACTVASYRALSTATSRFWAMNSWRSYQIPVAAPRPASTRAERGQSARRPCAKGSRQLTPESARLAHPPERQSLSVIIADRGCRAISADMHVLAADQEVVKERENESSVTSLRLRASTQDRWLALGRPPLPNIGRCVSIYLRADLYITNACGDRQLILVIQMVAAPNAESTLEDCQSQASRKACILVIPARSPYRSPGEV